MKRIVIFSIVVCFLVLSGLFALVEKTQGARAAGSTQAAKAPLPLSDRQIKDYVRKTQGQQAVDRMLHRVTQPLATRHYDAAVQTTLPEKQAGTLAPADVGHELYAVTPSAAGYIGDIGQQAFGVGGQFNAESVALPASTSNVTWVGLGFRGNSSTVLFPVLAGVDQISLSAAYLTGTGNNAVLTDVFKVNAQDQISAEVYQWDGNGWFIFIFDHTTGTYFSQIVNYDPGTTLTYTGWVLAVAPPGPLTNFLPVTFTNANWQGANSGGWQPLINAAYYDQLFLQPANGTGRAWTTEVSNPPGNSFSILYCPGCSG